MPRRSSKADIRTYQGGDTRSCGHKRAFRSERDAIDAAEFRMLENMKIDIGIYQCPLCHRWHLTRIKDVRPKA